MREFTDKKIVPNADQWDADHYLPINTERPAGKDHGSPLCGMYKIIQQPAGLVQCKTCQLLYLTLFVDTLLGNSCTFSTIDIQIY